MSIKNLAQTASPGTVIAGLFSTAPTGYLKLEGQSLLISDYPDLYAALNYSEANHPNTCNAINGIYFQLPNPTLKGDFFRQAPYGVSAGTRLDTAMRNIKGCMGVRDDATSMSGIDGVFSRGNDVNYDAASDNSSGGGWKVGFDSSKVTPTADEFRPKNIAVNYFIKY